METLHATCVALEEGAVLLTGPSGCGKSDLALRLIDNGGGLVADDRTVLAADQGGLWGSAPELLAGLLEVRGIGIIRLPVVASARVRVLIALGGPDNERLPETLDEEDIHGVTLPRFVLNGFHASAPAKVHLALRLATGLVERTE